MAAPASGVNHTPVPGYELASSMSPRAAGRNRKPLPPTWDELTTTPGATTTSAPRSSSVPTGGASSATPALRVDCGAESPLSSFIKVQQATGFERDAERVEEALEAGELCLAVDERGEYYPVPSEMAASMRDNSQSMAASLRSPRLRDNSSARRGAPTFAPDVSFDAHGPAAHASPRRGVVQPVRRGVDTDALGAMRIPDELPGTTASSRTTSILGDLASVDLPTVAERIAKQRSRVDAMRLYYDGTRGHEYKRCPKLEQLEAELEVLVQHEAILRMRADEQAKSAEGKTIPPIALHLTRKSGATVSDPVPTDGTGSTAAAGSLTESRSGANLAYVRPSEVLKASAALVGQVMFRTKRSTPTADSDAAATPATDASPPPPTEKSGAASPTPSRSKSSSTVPPGSSQSARGAAKQPHPPPGGATISARTTPVSKRAHSPSRPSTSASTLPRGATATPPDAHAAPPKTASSAPAAAQGGKKGLPPRPAPKAPAPPPSSKEPASKPAADADTKKDAEKKDGGDDAAPAAGPAPTRASRDRDARAAARREQLEYQAREKDLKESKKQRGTWLCNPPLLTQLFRVLALDALACDRAPHSTETMHVTPIHPSTLWFVALFCDGPLLRQFMAEATLVSTAHLIRVIDEVDALHIRTRRAAALKDVARAEAYATFGLALPKDLQHLNQHGVVNSSSSGGAPPSPSSRTSPSRQAGRGRSPPKRPAGDVPRVAWGVPLPDTSSVILEAAETSNIIALSVLCDSRRVFFSADQLNARRVFTRVVLLGLCDTAEQLALHGVFDPSFLHHLFHQTADRAAAKAERTRGVPGQQRVNSDGTVGEVTLNDAVDASRHTSPLRPDATPGAAALNTSSAQPTNTSFVPNTSTASLGPSSSNTNATSVTATSPDDDAPDDAVTAGLDALKCQKVRLYPYYSTAHIRYLFGANLRTASAMQLQGALDDRHRAMQASAAQGGLDNVAAAMRDGRMPALESTLTAFASARHTAANNRAASPTAAATPAAGAAAARATPSMAFDASRIGGGGTAFDDVLVIDTMSGGPASPTSAAAKRDTHASARERAMQREAPLLQPCYAVAATVSRHHVAVRGDVCARRNTGVWFFETVIDGDAILSGVDAIRVGWVSERAGQRVDGKTEYVLGNDDTSVAMSLAPYDARDRFQRRTPQQDWNGYVAAIAAYDEAVVAHKQNQKLAEERRQQAAIAAAQQAAKDRARARKRGGHAAGPFKEDDAASAPSADDAPPPQLPLPPECPNVCGELSPWWTAILDPIADGTSYPAAEADGSCVHLPTPFRFFADPPEVGARVERSPFAEVPTETAALCAVKHFKGHSQSIDAALPSVKERRRPTPPPTDAFAQGADAADADMAASSSTAAAGLASPTAASNTIEAARTASDVDGDGSRSPPFPAHDAPFGEELDGGDDPANDGPADRLVVDMRSAVNLATRDGRSFNKSGATSAAGASGDTGGDDGTSNMRVGPIHAMKRAVVVGCLLDTDRGEVSYFVNGHWLGLAYDELPAGEKYYPAVSTTQYKPPIDTSVAALGISSAFNAPAAVLIFERADMFAPPSHVHVPRFAPVPTNSKSGPGSRNNNNTANASSSSSSARAQVSLAAAVSVAVATLSRRAGDRLAGVASSLKQNKKGNNNAAADERGDSFQTCVAFAGARTPMTIAYRKLEAAIQQQAQRDAEDYAASALTATMTSEGTTPSPAAMKRLAASVARQQRAIAAAEELAEQQREDAAKAKQRARRKRRQTGFGSVPQVPRSAADAPPKQQQKQEDDDDGDDDDGALDDEWSMTITFASPTGAPAASPRGDHPSAGRTPGARRPAGNGQEALAVCFDAVKVNVFDTTAKINRFIDIASECAATTTMPGLLAELDASGKKSRPPMKSDGATGAASAGGSSSSTPADNKTAATVMRHRWVDNAHSIASYVKRAEASDETAAGGGRSRRSSPTRAGSPAAGASSRSPSPPAAAGGKKPAASATPSSGLAGFARSGVDPGAILRAVAKRNAERVNKAMQVDVLDVYVNSVLRSIHYTGVGSRAHAESQLDIDAVPEGGVVDPRRRQTTVARRTFDDFPLEAGAIVASFWDPGAIPAHKAATIFSNVPCTALEPIESATAARRRQLLASPKAGKAAEAKPPAVQPMFVPIMVHDEALNGTAPLAPREFVLLAAPTPLIHALYARLPAAALRLVQLPYCDVLTADSTGHTPLMLACALGYMAVVEAIVRRIRRDARGQQLLAHSPFVADDALAVTYEGDDDGQSNPHSLHNDSAARPPRNTFLSQLHDFAFRTARAAAGSGGRSAGGDDDGSGSDEDDSSGSEAEEVDENGELKPVQKDKQPAKDKTAAAAAAATTPTMALSKKQRDEVQARRDADEAYQKRKKEQQLASKVSQLHKAARDAARSAPPQLWRTAFCTAVDGTGITAVHAAIMTRHPACAAVVLQLIPSPPEALLDKLPNEHRKSFSEQVGAAVNVVTSTRNSATLLAAKLGYTELIRKLTLDYDASLAIADVNGVSPLLASCAFGRRDASEFIMTLLVERERAAMAALEACATHLQTAIDSERNAKRRRDEELALAARLKRERAAAREQMSTFSARTPGTVAAAVALAGTQRPPDASRGAGAAAQRARDSATQSPVPHSYESQPSTSPQACAARDRVRDALGALQICTDALAFNVSSAADNLHAIELDSVALTATTTMQATTGGAAVRRRGNTAGAASSTSSAAAAAADGTFRGTKIAGTALHWAAARALTQVCIDLISHGVSLTTKASGMTPILCACAVGHTATARAMLKQCRDMAVDYLLEQMEQDLDANEATALGTTPPLASPAPPDPLSPLPRRDSRRGSLVGSATHDATLLGAVAAGVQRRRTEAIATPEDALATVATILADQRRRRSIAITCASTASSASAAPSAAHSPVGSFRVAPRGAPRRDSAANDASASTAPFADIPVTDGNDVSASSAQAGTTAANRKRSVFFSATDEPSALHLSGPPAQRALGGVGHLRTVSFAALSSVFGGVQLDASRSLSTSLRAAALQVDPPSATARKQSTANLARRMSQVGGPQPNNNNSVIAKRSQLNQSFDMKTGTSTEGLSTLLDDAAATVDLATLPSQRIVAINASEDKYECTLLHLACEHGLDDLALDAIKLGVDVTARTKTFDTALHCAIFQNREQTAINFVLAAKNAATLDANAANRQGITPLLAACERGMASFVRVLMGTTDADANTADPQGLTPLQACLLYGHPDCAEALLDSARQTIRVSGSFAGKTPLQRAIDRGYRDVARALIGTFNVRATEEQSRALEQHHRRSTTPSSSRRSLTMRSLDDTTRDEDDAAYDEAAELRAMRARAAEMPRRDLEPIASPRAMKNFGAMLASQLTATTRPPDRVALKRVATVDKPLVLVDATPDAIAAAVAAIEAKQMAAAAERAAVVKPEVITRFLRGFTMQQLIAVLQHVVRGGGDGVDASRVISHYAAEHMGMAVPVMDVPKLARQALKVLQGGAVVLPHVGSDPVSEVASAGLVGRVVGIQPHGTPQQAAASPTPSLDDAAAAPPAPEPDSLVAGAHLVAERILNVLRTESPRSMRFATLFRRTVDSWMHDSGFIRPEYSEYFAARRTRSFMRALSKCLGCLPGAGCSALHVACSLNAADAVAALVDLCEAGTFSPNVWIAACPAHCGSLTGNPTNALRQLEQTLSRVAAPSGGASSLSGAAVVVRVGPGACPACGIATTESTHPVSSVQPTTGTLSAAVSPPAMNASMLAGDDIPALAGDDDGILADGAMSTTQGGNSSSTGQQHNAALLGQWFTPMRYAIEYGNETLANTLVEMFPSAPPLPDAFLDPDASCDASSSSAPRLPAKPTPVDVNILEPAWLLPSRESLLHVAIRKRNTRMIRLLVDLGADVFARNAAGIDCLLASALQSDGNVLGVHACLSAAPPDWLSRAADCDVTPPAASTNTAPIAPAATTPPSSVASDAFVAFGGGTASVQPSEGGPPPPLSPSAMGGPSASAPTPPPSTTQSSRRVRAFVFSVAAHCRQALPLVMQAGCPPDVTDPVTGDTLLTAVLSSPTPNPPFAGAGASVLFGGGSTMASYGASSTTVGGPGAPAAASAVPSAAATGSQHEGEATPRGAPRSGVIAAAAAAASHTLRDSDRALCVLLIRQFNVSITAANKAGNTPLYLAACHHDMELCSIIVGMLPDRATAAITHLNAKRVPVWRALATMSFPRSKTPLVLKVTQSIDTAHARRTWVREVLCRLHPVTVLRLLQQYPNDVNVAPQEGSAFWQALFFVVVFGTPDERANVPRRQFDHLLRQLFPCLQTTLLVAFFAYRARGGEAWRRGDIAKIPAQRSAQAQQGTRRGRQTRDASPGGTAADTTTSTKVTFPEGQHAPPTRRPSMVGGGASGMFRRRSSSVHMSQHDTASVGTCSGSDSDGDLDPTQPTPRAAAGPPSRRMSFTRRASLSMATSLAARPRMGSSAGAATPRGSATPRGGQTPLAPAHQMPDSSALLLGAGQHVQAGGGFLAAKLGAAGTAAHADAAAAALLSVMGAGAQVLYPPGVHPKISFAFNEFLESEATDATSAQASNATPERKRPFGAPAPHHHVGGLLSHEAVADRLLDLCFTTNTSGGGGAGLTSAMSMDFYGDVLELAARYGLTEIFTLVSQRGLTAASSKLTVLAQTRGLKYVAAACNKKRMLSEFVSNTCDTSDADDVGAMTVTLATLARHGFLPHRSAYAAARAPGGGMATRLARMRAGAPSSPRAGGGGAATSDTQAVPAASQLTLPYNLLDWAVHYSPFVPRLAPHAKRAHAKRAASPAGKAGVSSPTPDASPPQPQQQQQQHAVDALFVDYASLTTQTGDIAPLPAKTYTCRPHDLVRRHSAHHHATLTAAVPRRSFLELAAVVDHLLDNRCPLSLPLVEFMRSCPRFGLDYLTERHRDSLLHVAVLRDQPHVVHFLLANSDIAASVIKPRKKHTDQQQQPQQQQQQEMEQSATMGDDYHSGGGAGPSRQDVTSRFTRYTWRNSHGRIPCDYAHSSTMLQLLATFGVMVAGDGNGGVVEIAPSPFLSMCEALGDCSSDSAIGAYLHERDIKAKLRERMDVLLKEHRRIQFVQSSMARAAAGGDDLDQSSVSLPAISFGGGDTTDGARFQRSVFESKKIAAFFSGIDDRWSKRDGAVPEDGPPDASRASAANMSDAALLKIISGEAKLPYSDRRQSDAFFLDAEDGCRATTLRRERDTFEWAAAQRAESMAPSPVSTHGRETRQSLRRRSSMMLTARTQSQSNLLRSPHSTGIDSRLDESEFDEAAVAAHNDDVSWLRGAEELWALDDLPQRGGGLFAHGHSRLIDVLARSAATAANTRPRHAVAHTAATLTAGQADPQRFAALLASTVMDALALEDRRAAYDRKLVEVARQLTRRGFAVTRAEYTVEPVCVFKPVSDDVALYGGNATPQHIPDPGAGATSGTNSPMIFTQPTTALCPPVRGARSAATPAALANAAPPPHRADSRAGTALSFTGPLSRNTNDSGQGGARPGTTSLPAIVDNIVSEQTHVKLHLPATGSSVDKSRTSRAGGDTTTAMSTGPSSSPRDGAQTATSTAAATEGGANNPAPVERHRSCVLLVSLPLYHVCKLRKLLKVSQYSRSVHWSDEVDAAGTNAFIDGDAPASAGPTRGHAPPPPPPQTLTAAMVAVTEGHLREVAGDVLGEHDMAIVPHYTTAKRER